MSEDEQWEETGRQAIEDVDGVIEQLKRNDKLYNDVNSVSKELKALRDMVLSILNKYQSHTNADKPLDFVSIATRIRVETEKAIREAIEKLTEATVKDAEDT